MAATESRVSSSIDFDAEGRQAGWLNVPYSRNDSAWGAIRLPVVSIRNGDGPTILFTGGNHGDEYEGILALHKLGRHLLPEQIRGRVIIVPALNLPAVRAGTRVSPIDAGNMNRVFPGDRNGTITWVIAHYVTHELIPRADVVVDMHSGGKTLDFIPAAIMHRLEDKELETRTLDALRAFGAPIGLVIEELDMDGMLDGEVERRGTMFISTELGGAGTVTTDSLAIAERGIGNLLRHFGVMSGDLETAARSERPAPTRLMDVPSADCYVVADEGGILEPLADLGDEIALGQPVARLHFIETPHRDPVDLIARAGGTIICRRTHAQATSGDVVAVIAAELRAG